VSLDGLWRFGVWLKRLPKIEIGLTAISDSNLIAIHAQHVKGKKRRDETPDLSQLKSGCGTPV